MTSDPVKTTNHLNGYDTPSTAHYHEITKTAHDAPIKKETELTPKATPVVHAPTISELLIDKVTGLIQHITKDGITHEVIRKMPSDEYLKLLQLMNHGLNRSLDKHV
jgi:hypothetical protein